MTVREACTLTPLERAILRAVVELGENAYGVPVRALVEAQRARFLSIGRLYVTAGRLVEEGFLKSFDVTTDRTRRYWRPAFDLTEVLREP